MKFFLTIFNSMTLCIFSSTLWIRFIATKTIRILLSVISHPSILANAASSSALAGNYGIVKKAVSIDAHISNMSDHIPMNTSLQIDSLRHDLHVGWIHTCAISTKMINNKTVRNFPDKMLIGSSMRHIASSILPRTSVPIWKHNSVPQPTFFSTKSGFNIGDSLNEGFVFLLFHWKKYSHISPNVNHVFGDNLA